MHNRLAWIPTGARSDLLLTKGRQKRKEEEENRAFQSFFLEAVSLLLFWRLAGGAADSENDNWNCLVAGNVGKVCVCRCDFKEVFYLKGGKTNYAKKNCSIVCPIFLCAVISCHRNFPPFFDFLYFFLSRPLFRLLPPPRSSNNNQTIAPSRRRKARAQLFDRYRYCPSLLFPPRISEQKIQKF